jgi:hypothetical protein
MKFEPTPKQYCIAFSFGQVTAHLKEMYGNVDPTIERIQETFALIDLPLGSEGDLLPKLDVFKIPLN